MQDRQQSTFFSKPSGNIKKQKTSEIRIVKLPNFVKMRAAACGFFFGRASRAAPQKNPKIPAILCLTWKKKKKTMTRAWDHSTPPPEIG